MSSGKIMIQDPIIDTSTVDEGPLSSFTKILKANSQVSRSSITKPWQGK